MEKKNRISTPAQLQGRGFTAKRPRSRHLTLEQKLGGGDATGTKSGARLVGEVHPGEVVNNIQPQMGIAHTYTYTYTYTYIYIHMYISARLTRPYKRRPLDKGLNLVAKALIWYSHV